MKRILIKLSGEALSSKDKKLAIDPSIVNDLVAQIKTIVSKNIEVGIVVGGGNFWRGAPAEKNGMSRNKADYIGMLATVMNGLAMQSAFEQINVKARIQSSLAVDQKVAENYVNEKTLKALSNKEIVIFAGGTGRPFFTTDTAAVLVSSEIGASTILMGKNGIKGVYDCDPKKNAHAKKYDKITYDNVLSQELKVMDTTAVAMARDNNIGIIIFDINEKNALIRAIDKNIEHTEVIK